MFCKSRRVIGSSRPTNSASSAAFCFRKNPKSSPAECWRQFANDAKARGRQSCPAARARQRRRAPCRPIPATATCWQNSSSAEECCRRRAATNTIFQSPRRHRPPPPHCLHARRKRGSRRRCCIPNPKLNSTDGRRACFPTNSFFAAESESP